MGRRVNNSEHIHRSKIDAGIVKMNTLVENDAYTFTTLDNYNIILEGFT